jgi:hypothetical protein
MKQQLSTTVVIVIIAVVVIVAGIIGWKMTSASDNSNVKPSPSTKIVLPQSQQNRKF